MIRHSLALHLESLKQVGLLDNRLSPGVFFLVVYVDPRHRVHIGSASLAPKCCFIVAEAIEGANSIPKLLSVLF